MPITDQQDDIVLQQEERPTTAMSEATANIMNELLQFVIYGDQGTGRSAAFGGTLIGRCMERQVQQTTITTDGLWAAQPIMSAAHGLDSI